MVTAISLAVALLSSTAFGARFVPPEPESSIVPKFCAQYQPPVVAFAAPIPMTLYPLFSIFARWPSEPSQPSITSAGVVYPAATFSAMPPPP